MKSNNIINTLGLHTVDFITRPGTFRAIVKVQAGFYTAVDDLGIQAGWGRKQWNSGIEVLRGFKKGALQTIEFQPEGTLHWLTVFAMKGKKVVLIDESILQDITVGDINSLFVNTNLYSQHQYMAVGAKTWASKAFTMNGVEEAA